MQRCPIYDSTTACDTHPDCLFLRKGGCAIVLAATLAEKNREQIANISAHLDDIDRNIIVILRKLGIVG